MLLEEHKGRKPSPPESTVMNHASKFYSLSIAAFYKNKLLEDQAGSPNLLTFSPGCFALNAKSGQSQKLGTMSQQRNLNIADW